MNETTLRNFLLTATLKNGNPFTINNIYYNPQGLITGLSGVVNTNEKIMWNGYCACITHGSDYALIHDIAYNVFIGASASNTGL